MLSNFVVPRIHGSVLPPSNPCTGEIKIGHPSLVRMVLLGWILSITADELYRCNGYNKSREKNYNQSVQPWFCSLRSCSTYAFWSRIVIVTDQLHCPPIIVLRAQLARITHARASTHRCIPLPPVHTLQLLDSLLSKHLRIASCFPLLTELQIRERRGSLLSND